MCFMLVLGQAGEWPVSVHLSAVTGNPSNSGSGGQTVAIVACCNLAAWLWVGDGFHFCQLLFSGVSRIMHVSMGCVQVCAHAYASHSCKNILLI